MKIKEYLERKGIVTDIISIKELGGGTSHFNYLITTPTSKLVLRKDIDKSTKGKLEREYIALDAIKALNIAPYPVIFERKSPIGPFIILNYLDGTLLSKRGYQLSHAFIKQLALEVAELHSIPINALKNKIPLEYHNPKFYLKEIKDYKKQLKPYVKSKEFFLWIDRVTKKIYKSNKKFKANYCLVHSDIQEHNILIERKSIKFIDWESVMISDPASDISYIFTQFGRIFNNKQKKQFMEEYLKNRKDISLKERVEFYIPIKFFISFLWSILQTVKIQKGILYYPNKKKSVADQKTYTRHGLQTLVEAYIIDKSEENSLKKIIQKGKTPGLGIEPRDP